MTAISPGAREIDPDAEVLRLVKDRVPEDHREYRILIDEVHDISPDGAPPVRAHIVVTASRPGAAREGLGARIAEVVRASWAGR